MRHAKLKTYPNGKEEEEQQQEKQNKQEIYVHNFIGKVNLNA